MEWSKDFQYKKEAVIWCKLHNFQWMTEKEWDSYWQSALREADKYECDIYEKAAEILNNRLFNAESKDKCLLDLENMAWQKAFNQGRTDMAKEIASAMFEIGIPFLTVDNLFRCTATLSTTDLSEIRASLKQQGKLPSAERLGSFRILGQY